MYRICNKGESISLLKASPFIISCSFAFNVQSLFNLFIIWICNRFINVSHNGMPPSIEIPAPRKRTMSPLLKAVETLLI